MYTLGEEQTQEFKTFQKGEVFVKYDWIQDTVYYLRGLPRKSNRQKSENQTELNFESVERNDNADDKASLIKIKLN